MLNNSGSANCFKAASSYISAELNIASELSWKGKIFCSSPLLTDPHMPKVRLAEAPLVRASRTSLLMSLPSVVGILLCSSILSVVRAEI